jgi:hypothetical protein
LEAGVEKIGLVETIAALRAELTEAAVGGDGAPIKFQVGAVTLDFHVGVTRDAEAKAGVRFWVVELGATGGYTAESIQRVTVTLTPVQPDGQVVHLSDDFD